VKSAVTEVTKLAKIVFLVSATRSCRSLFDRKVALRLGEPSRAEWCLAKNIVRWFLRPLSAAINDHFVSWFGKQAKVPWSLFHGARFGAVGMVGQQIGSDARIEKFPQFSGRPRLSLGVLKQGVPRPERVHRTFEGKLSQRQM